MRYIVDLKSQILYHTKISDKRFIYLSFTESLSANITVIMKTYKKTIPSSIDVRTGGPGGCGSPNQTAYSGAALYFCTNQIFSQMEFILNYFNNIIL